MSTARYTRMYDFNTENVKLILEMSRMWAFIVNITDVFSMNIIIYYITCLLHDIKHVHTL